jgi:hypothetical protein
LRHAQKLNDGATPRDGKVEPFGRRREILGFAANPFEPRATYFRSFI